MVVPREYNPQFEMDFNSKADYDFDRQRSEAKKLQRQMVKEKRGAMRELRRDASFMAAVSGGGGSASNHVGRGGSEGGGRSGSCVGTPPSWLR